MKTFELSIVGDITDLERLYRTACQHCISKYGMSRTEAEKELKDGDGNIDTVACIMELIGPGSTPGLTFTGIHIELGERS